MRSSFLCQHAWSSPGVRVLSQSAAGGPEGRHAPSPPDRPADCTRNWPYPPLIPGVAGPTGNGPGGTGGSQNRLPRRHGCRGPRGNLEPGRGRRPTIRSLRGEPNQCHADPRPSPIPGPRARIDVGGWRNRGCAWVDVRKICRVIPDSRRDGQSRRALGPPCRPVSPGLLALDPPATCAAGGEHRPPPASHRRATTEPGRPGLPALALVLPGGGPVGDQPRPTRTGSSASATTVPETRS